MSKLSRLPRTLRWCALAAVAAAGSGCAVYPAYPEQVAMAPAPGVVYGPPGVAVAPAPVYVAPPPVYYGPPPVSLNLGFGYYRHYGGGGRHYWRGRR